MPTTTDDAAAPPQMIAHPLATALAEKRRLSLKPPPRMNVVEWADRYRMLSREASSTGGRWETSRVPIARGPMLGLTEPGVHELTVMGPTQMLKTELILNFIGFKMHAAPGPGLVVYPDEDAAEMFSNSRLDPMLRDTPVLRELVGTRKKTASNRVGHKEFPGGEIDIVSGRDPMEIASRPREWILFDEIDLLTKNIIGSGDPRRIAVKRMETFPATWKAIYVCSPTVAGSSTIGRLYAASDQRQPYLPCPHCGFEQLVKWRDIWWQKDVDEDGNVVKHHPATAAVRCQNPDCAKLWSEPQRRDAPRYAKWRQTRKFHCCGHEQDPQVTRLWEWDPVNEIGYAVCDTCGARAVPNRHAGYHPWRVHSPWRPLHEVVTEFLEVKDNPVELQTFVNTVLAEEWEDARKFETTAEALAARREVYAADVPSGVGILTCGIDTHENRLEVEVVGWGMDEESWGIDRRVFAGDPALPDVWLALDEYLQRQWVREDGRRLVIQATCIDYGGHRGAHVANFCVPRSGRRVWAVRGKSENSDKRTPIWPRKPTVKTQGRFPLYEIGTNAAKDVVFARIDLQSPGPGFMHFPSHYDFEALEQLTVEKLVRRQSGRVAYEVWECPPGKRNESTDCRVYAYAALHGLKAAGLQVNRAVQAAGAVSTEPSPPRPIPSADSLSARAAAAPPTPTLSAQPRAGIVETNEPRRPQPSRRRSGGSDWLNGRGRW